MKEEPKPGSWLNKSLPKPEETSKKIKKPFVRKPHLSDRPFKANERFAELIKDIIKPK